MSAGEELELFVMPSRELSAIHVISLDQLRSKARANFIGSRSSADDGFAVTKRIPERNPGVRPHQGIQCRVNLLPDVDFLERTTGAVGPPPAVLLPNPDNTPVKCENPRREPGVFTLERTTGFEPATLTLAR